MNTHTLYAHYARQRKKAIEIIVNTRRFLFSDDLSKEELQEKVKQDITPYLGIANPATSPTQKQIDALVSNPKLDNPAGQQKIQARRDALSQYTKSYNDAVAGYHEASQKLKQLKADGDMFLSPKSENANVPDKRKEYLHIIDKETCTHLCEDQGKEEDCPISFTNKTDIQLRGDETDAVRIWRNNVLVDHLTITDNRPYIDIAHRDGIQLIPPPTYEKQEDDKGSVKFVKLADQMVGTILEDVTISNCHINAPKGALQGIFSSDGLCRNIKLNNVSISTMGAHSISLSGVLTGCEIKNVTLRQVKGGHVPQISLYPLRIGGNMADDGMVYIFHFGGTSKLSYGEVVQGNNKIYTFGQSQPEAIKIVDHRAKMPEKYLKMAVALRNFDYETYLEQYTTWTLGDFKRQMPAYFTRMKQWIDLRVQEYSSGVRVAKWEVSLANVSPEQSDLKKHGVLDMLREAQKALNTNEFDNTRIPELQQTAVRSFAMKCIAVENGDPDDFYDLGEHNNKIRRIILGFLLGENNNHFNNLVENPYKKDEDTRQDNNFAEPLPSIKPDDADTWSTVDDRALEKALRVSPSLSVPKGQDIHFSFDEASPYNDDQKYSYRWSVPSSNLSVGINKNYSIKTDNLDVDRRYRLFCDVTKNGKMQRVIAFFAATEEVASTQIESIPSAPETIPNAEFTTRKPTLAKDKETVFVGDKVTFSLDAIYEEARFYWIFDGNQSTPQKGSDASLVVNTEGLSSGKYRVRGTVTSKDRQQHSVSMWVHVVEKIITEEQDSNKIGDINLIVRDIDSGNAIVGEEYILEFEGKTYYSHRSVTGDDGSIRLTGVPTGNYRLFFTNTELSVINN